MKKKKESGTWKTKVPEKSLESPEEMQFSMQLGESPHSDDSAGCRVPSPRQHLTLPRPPRWAAGAGFLLGSEALGLSSLLSPFPGMLASDLR